MKSQPHASTRRRAAVPGLAALALTGVLFLPTVAAAQKGEEQQAREEAEREAQELQREAQERERRAQQELRLQTEELRKLQEALRQSEQERRARSQELRAEIEALQQQLTSNESEVRREIERAVEAERAARRESERARRQLVEEMRAVEREAARARIEEERALALATRDRTLLRMRTSRPRLGITVRDAADPKWRERAAQVASVRSDGPAAEAGLREGDLILEVNGVDLEDSGDDDPSNRLIEVVRELEDGDSAKLTVRRGDEQMTLEVVARTLDTPLASQLTGRLLPELAWAAPEPPPAPAAPRPPGLFSSPEPLVAPVAPRVLRELSFFGRGTWHDMEIVPVSEQLGEYFGVEGGLLVVEPPSDDLVDLQAGDVILRIGDREPRDLPHAMRILRSYEAGEAIRVEVMRKKRRQMLEGTLPKASSAFPGQASWPAVPAAPAAVEGFLYPVLSDAPAGSI